MGHGLPLSGGRGGKGWLRKEGVESGDKHRNKKNTKLEHYSGDVKLARVPYMGPVILEVLYHLYC